MDKFFDLSGKTAVVTGATGVLCSDMARELARRGVKVAVMGLEDDLTKQIADEINDDGGTAIGVVVDVLDKDSLIRARDAVMEEFGGIDILINGAGGNHKNATVSPNLSFFDIPKEALQFVFNLNILGTIMSTQVFGEVMTKQGRGSVINISSMNAYTPLTNIVAYSAAKAGINNFTQWMAVHFNLNYSPDIRVNAIAPGFFLTKQNHFLLVDEKTGGHTPRAKQILGHTPMNRYGVPEDLLGTIVYLASDASSFVNGVVIPIDGGFSAYSGV
ncbi:MAG TPA: D-mannonate oxidoreductase [Clostridiales bacterium]|nr:SDR family oxidoreductase [Clostridia bacterium]HCS74855.1 D-mannonate oxidoreductase [Clostridiales bacterium]